MDTLSTQEAAERLGVTVRRVNDLIASGKLPAERFGRAHVIREADLKLVEDPPLGRPPKLTPAEIEASTATTRKLNKSVRTAAEKEMGRGGKKASRKK